MAVYGTPGSLTLKSVFPMEYSRAVLSNKWHVKREGEPKDFELWSGDKPSLHRSTYKILAKQLPNDDFAKKSEAHSAQEKMFEDKEDYRYREATQKMVDFKNYGRLLKQLDRDTNDPIPSMGTLPRHRKGHDAHYLETTYISDFKHPSPDVKTIHPKDKPIFDNSFAHRRMISQFSDSDAPKREGINTFHVQTGVYPNQHMKQQLSNEKFVFY